MIQSPGDGPEVYISIQMQISREQLQEFTEDIEDTVEYACDQYTMSGEKAWAIIECLAVAKQAEIAGLVASDVA